MKRFYKSKPDKMEVSDMGLTGFNFILHCQAAAVNTTPLMSEIDLAEIDIEINRYHRGQKINVFDGSLKQITMYATLGKSDLVNRLQNAFMGLEFALVQEAVGQEGIGEFRIPFDLPVPMVLKGTDYVEVKVSMSGDVFGASIDGAVNVSYCEVKEVKGVHEEVSIGVLETQIVEANQKQVLVNGGDFVTGVYFISEAAIDGSVYLVDRIVESVSFSSDKYNDDRSYLDLLSQRQRTYFNVQDSTFGGESFKLSPELPEGISLNNMNATVKLYDQNVNVGENVVIVEKELLIASVLEDGLNRINKHNQENKLSIA